MNQTAPDVTQEIERYAQQFQALKTEIAKVIVGQNTMIDRLLLAILAGGHVLVEGLPGLAKTTAIKTLASAVNASFTRVQFTPDLLPADLIGTQIYRPNTGEFSTRKGPVFTNFLLADEINRAPAKVQSALLEAMAERQVTLANETHPLQEPFIVLATQNPIEQEGTYPLPEAQVDRFMLKLRVGYPNKVEEKEIMQRMAQGEVLETARLMEPADLLAARKLTNSIYVDDKVADYIVDIVFATREPGLYGLKDLESLIEYGASPRATIYLNRACRAYAFLAGRTYVTPQDVKTIGPDILRHRLLLSYEAEAQDLTSDDLIERIFNTVDVP
jgi:MoxR-like ATPase